MIRRWLLAREMFLVVALAVLCVAFSVRVEGFFDWENLLRQSRYWVATGVIAVPMTFIIATGGIDLSVGAIVALGGIVLGMAYNDYGAPIVAAAAAAIAVGMLCGAVNGGVSSYVGVPPLVVTLATMALFRGIAMGISQADPFGNFPEGFGWLGRGNLFEVFPAAPPGWYFPVALLVMLGVFAAGGVLLRRSWIGRFTECIGENERAAAFAAIDVRRMKLGLYTACGALCGLAAVLHTALNTSAKADTARGMELDAIACVVVGGTRISGGQASVLGSLLGLLIIGILRYGLKMGGVKSQYEIIYVGLLLIVTAVVNERMAARNGARK